MLFYEASQGPKLQKTIFQSFNELDEREDEMRYKRENDENFKKKFFELSKKYNENPKAIMNRTEYRFSKNNTKNNFNEQNKFEFYKLEEYKNDENEVISDTKKKIKFDKKSKPFFPSADK